MLGNTASIHVATDQAAQILKKQDPAPGKDTRMLLGYTPRSKAQTTRGITPYG